MISTERAPAQFTVNGVRVLYYQNASFLTSIQILTGVGSAAETEESQGLAHILEHMFFKGSAKRRGGSAISRAANDIGGKLNAYTVYDHTCYYITVLNDRFHAGFDILADMYLHPLFPADEFAKELNPILSEFREHQDDPDNIIIERSLQQFFGPVYHPVIGTEATIRAATVEKMHEFRRRYYGGDNVLIVVVGGVEESAVRDVVAAAFADSGKTEKPPTLVAAHNPGQATWHKPGIQEAHYNLLFPALPPGHPDRYKQDVMNYVLGGNESALLFERIREELGLSCYGIYSWIMRHDPFTALGVSCGIAPEQLDQLHREVLDQIKLICDGPLEAERLERAKASLRTSIAARSETSSGMAGMIALPALRGEADHPVQRALEEIEAITVEDVLEQARSTLSGPMFHSALLPED